MGVGYKGGRGGAGTFSDQFFKVMIFTVRNNFTGNFVSCLKINLFFSSSTIIYEKGILSNKSK